MNNVAKIGTIEAIAFIIIVIVNRIILNVPKEIIESTGSSAWLNVIFISIIVILFMLIICKLFKKFPGYDIIDVSKFLGGNIFKTIIGIIYFILFLVVAVTVLRSFANTLQTIYLQTSPIAYIMLFFIIGMIWSNKLGFSSILKINVIVVLLILISVIGIFVFPISNYSVSNLTPVLGYGINETFLSGLTNIFAFSGVIYICFLLPFLKKTDNFKKISLVAVVIASIYLLLSIISLLALFGFKINSEDMLSLLLLTRITNLGHFFQRIDAVFVFIWILTFLSYLSILKFFMLYTFKKVTNISNYNGMIYCFSAIIFGLALIPTDIAQMDYIQNNILKYFIISVCFVLPIIILVGANIKNRFFKKKKLNISP